MDEQPYKELGDRLLHALGTRTITWLAERCGVSRPAASQWVSGKLRPERLRVPSIAEALGLAEEEILRAGHYSEEGSRGVFAVAALASADVDRAREDVDDFYQTRVRGDALRTISKIDAWLPWLESKKRVTKSSRLYQELLLVQAHALYQKAESYMELLPPKDLTTIASTVVDAMYALANECDHATAQEEVKRLADYQAAAIEYHNGNYGRAVAAYEAILDDVDSKTFDGRALEAERTLAICYAYRKDLRVTEKRREISRLHKKIQSKVATGQFSDEIVTETLEGVGRALGLVGMPSEGYALIKDGEAIITSNNLLTPFRVVQLIKSELEIIYQDPTEKSFLQIRGEEGLRLARLFRYKRYEQRILQLLTMALNE